MRYTLMILSHLLRYPSQELREAAPELVMQLELDGVLGGNQIESLRPLVHSLIEDELLDLQESYTSLFDRGRALSLHLFEHVHGESRDRGQAMVDLRTRYVAQGLEISANELPDYLPLSSNIFPCCHPRKPWRNWPSRGSLSRLWLAV